MPDDSKRSYPWTTTLKDRQITLRLMRPEDRDALMGFAKSLPEDDLLFLAVDITRPEALDQWVHNIKSGLIKTVVAEANGKLIGHGTLSHNALQWTRHLGEIVLLISPTTAASVWETCSPTNSFRSRVSWVCRRSSRAWLLSSRARFKFSSDWASEPKLCWATTSSIARDARTI